MKNIHKYYLPVLLVLLSQQLRAQENIWESIENKANWFLQGQGLLKDKNKTSSDFSEFYEKFISDSLFQFQHISPAIVGAIGYCESTKEINQDNWEKISYHYKTNFDNPRYSYVIVSSDSRFFLRSTLIEIGVISEIGFEKIEGQWYLTLFSVNAC